MVGRSFSLSPLSVLDCLKTVTFTAQSEGATLFPSREASTVRLFSHYTRFVIRQPKNHAG